MASLSRGGGSGPGSSAVMPAMGSGKQSAAAGEIFVFLCPNGHKLNGPPSLKGKPGQCPHCGARFIIPTDDDIEDFEEEEPVEDEPPPDEDDTANDEPVEGRGLDFDRLLQDAPAAESDKPPAGPSGLGFIMGRLWEQRTEQVELEVFLNEGEIIAPEYYCEKLSTSDYAVFAVREGDGTLAISVIPWNAVRRVAMRRIEELPEDLFK